MQAIPTLFVVAAILGVPVLAAWLLGKVFQLEQYVWKMWLVFFSIVLAVLPLALRYPNALKLGVDLSGGTILVYQVDPTQVPPEGFEMDNMIAAIIERINPSGTVDVTVRPSGENRVEIIIPRASDEEVRRYKRMITNLGSLEFRILANQKDHAPLIRRGELSFPRPVTRPIRFDVDLSFQQELEANESSGEGEISKELRGLFADNALELAETAKVLAGSPEDSTWVIASKGRTLSLEKEDGAIVARGERIEAEWIAVDEKQQAKFEQDGQVAARTDPEAGLMVLVVRERPRYEVTGQYLRRAMRGIDSRTGLPNVEFQFDSKGARRFGRLTGENVPDRDGFKRRLAIVMSGTIQSAPTINSKIRDQGEISGDFTVAEVDDLVQVLNAGSLPAALDTVPVMEQTIGPTLGRDTIEKATWAILFSVLAVLVFIAIYYLYFAGTVADLCLVLNLLFVVGIMSWTEATFTLPGLAGLVLTVGMSIDANVLIFERIREERDRGGALRVAIRNGFSRAYRTIIDANITTLLTAVILYSIGTDQVKGFAVTLIIGILMSMYTAMFVSRLLFDIFERKSWIKEVPMLRIVGSTRFDFLGKRVPCLTASAALIVLGMVAIFGRGSNLLDIDFTGGTLVSIRLNEPESSEEVRKLASTIPDVTVEDLTLGGKRSESGKFSRFLLRTTEQDPEIVKEGIISAFGERLVRIEMNYSNLEPIPENSTSGEAGSEGESGETEASDETAAEEEHRFAGGSRVELSFNESLTVATVEGYFADYFEEAEGLSNAALQFDVTGMGEGTEDGNHFRQMILETSFEQQRMDPALAMIKTQFASEPLFDRVSNFGGQVAGETKQLAIIAMMASLVAIVGYIWIRFQAVTFGLAAVAALVHDVLIVLGLVALSGWLVEGTGGIAGQVLLLDVFKINLPMIAAFMTLVGYSLNDTIVVFDRIREVRGKSPEITKEMVNASVNQSLSRTLLTSLTTLLAVAILYVWGGEGIHGFAFCLVAGVFVGTYSSIYIASPVLIWLSSRHKEAGSRERSRSKKRLPVANPALSE